MTKKVAFWLNFSLTVLMLLTEVELMSILPFAVFSYLLGMIAFKGRKYEVGAIVLAFIMAVINFLVPSAVDVLVWLVSAFLVMY